MYSAEFADLARIHPKRIYPKAFTRQRALSLPHRVSMLLSLRKGSIGDELNRFFEVPHDKPLADGVSHSAFCQACMKLDQLDPRALLALNRLFWKASNATSRPVCGMACVCWQSGTPSLLCPDAVGFLPREVSAFGASGKNREAVLFTPGPHARQHCQTYGLATDPIPLRLIRMKLKNGELRWGVEEGYKRKAC